MEAVSQALVETQGVQFIPVGRSHVEAKQEASTWILIQSPDSQTFFVQVLVPFFSLHLLHELEHMLHLALKLDTPVTLHRDDFYPQLGQLLSFHDLSSSHGMASSNAVQPTCEGDS